MKRSLMCSFGLTVAAFVACTVSPAAVDLKPEERENLGIKTEQPQALAIVRTSVATAQVLDPTPLISASGELRSAELAAVASRAEADRSERLYREGTNIARKALDAARVQALADQTHVETARAQLLVTWGRGLASFSPAAVAMLVSDLLEGRASLARADLLTPLPLGPDVPTAQARTFDGRSHWQAQWISSLPQVTNTTLAGAALLRIPAGLAAGTLLEVTFSDPRTSRQGLGVPASAVIRWHGAQWVYAETSPNHFERHQVGPMTADGRAPLQSDGKGLSSVVTVGARSLLAAELGAAEPLEEEDPDD
jgi:hypothetical protein